MTGILSSTMGTFFSGQKITVTELNKTSTTTLNGGTNTTTSLTTANINTVTGRIYIAMLAWDPGGASLPTVTVTRGSNSFTALSTLYPAPATTSSGTGVIIQSFILNYTFGTQASPITATFSGTTTNKAMTIIELQGATTTQRNAATTSRGTTAAPSYGAPAGNRFDLVLATLGQETNNANAPTAAGGNLIGGIWQGLSNNFTTGGGAATNVGISYQYKLLTSNTTATVGWTMGSANNWGSQSFAIQAA